MVDDEPDLDFLIQQRFRIQISMKQLRFHFARNGSQALEILEKEPNISLMVTDLNMPQMNGLELLLQTRIKFPKVTNVVISAYGDTKTIQEATAMGATHFLTKPLNFKIFEEILRGNDSRLA